MCAVYNENVAHAPARRFFGWSCIAILPTGHLAVVETGTGDVITIDVDTGAKAVLARPVSLAHTLLDAVPAWALNGIAVGPSGNLYVSSPRDGKVHRITFE